MSPLSKKKIAAKKKTRKKTTKEKESRKVISGKKVAKKKIASARSASRDEVAKKPTKTPDPGIASIGITLEERLKMIAVAAYHKAEKRGFAPGNELQDWTEAEQEIDELMLV